MNPISRLKGALLEDARELVRSLSVPVDESQVKPHSNGTVAQNCNGHDPMKSIVIVVSQMPNGYVARTPYTLGEYLARSQRVNQL